MKKLINKTFYDTEEYNGMENSQPTCQKQNSPKNLEETKTNTTFAPTDSSTQLGKRIQKAKSGKEIKGAKFGKKNNRVKSKQEKEVFSIEIESESPEDFGNLVQYSNPQQNFDTQEEISIPGDLSVNQKCLSTEKNKNDSTKKTLDDSSSKKITKKDSMRIQSGTMFFRSYFGLLDKRCKRHNYSLKRINFEKNFGYSISKNRAFIKRSIKNILSFNSSTNRIIIYNMIYKVKDRVFEELVKLRFKEAYNLFIKNSHFIKINEANFHLSHYQTLNECLEKKKLSKKKILTNEFIETAKNLISIIEGNGKLIQRRQRKNLFRKKIYFIRYKFHWP